MRVLVCGGRDFTNVAFIWLQLDRIHETAPITELMQGGADGTDYLANEWAKTKSSIKRWVCKAEWEKYGKSAGPKRNARMLEWKPDLVVAFPGGRGTANMCKQARDAGVPVKEMQ
jgi:YspA, cpYpsA-related SLOG family